MSGLKPAFAKDGSVTAANASGINDGAAAVLVMSEARAAALGLEPAHHLTDGGAADLEPFGDARLDDVDVVLRQLEDALAVLLEGGVVLTGHRHAVILGAVPPAGSLCPH